MKVVVTSADRHDAPPVSVDARLFDEIAKVKRSLVASKPAGLAGLLSSDFDLYSNGRRLSDSDRLVELESDSGDVVKLLAAPSRQGLSAASSPIYRPNGFIRRAGPTYWPPELETALEAASNGLEHGLDPRLTEEGEGGTYFVLGQKQSDDCHGSGDDSDGGYEYVACFKPRDEEQYAPNNPRDRRAPFGTQGSRVGVPSGDGYAREIAAYILDHGGVAGVPPTGLVEAWHPAFSNGDSDELISPHSLGSGSTTHRSALRSSPRQSPQQGPQPSPTLSATLGPAPIRKTGSFQLFVKDASKIESTRVRDALPDREVQKVAILDLRLLNLDRNEDNVLLRYEMRDPPPEPEPTAATPADGEAAAPAKPAVRRWGRPRKILTPVLVPIDHGFVIPSDLGVADCDWVWLEWPQVRRPLDPGLRDYVLSLDVEADIALLKAALGPAIQPACFNTLRVTYALLQRGVRAGMTLHNIARVMCRTGDLRERSPLERFVATAEITAAAALHNDRLAAAGRYRGALVGGGGGNAPPSASKAAAATSGAATAKQLQTIGASVVADGSHTATELVAAPTEGDVTAPAVLGSSSDAYGSAASSAQHSRITLPQSAGMSVSAEFPALGEPATGHTSSVPGVGTTDAAHSNIAAWAAARAASAVQGRQRVRIRGKTLPQIASLLGLNAHASLLRRHGVEVSVALAMSSDVTLVAEHGGEGGQLYGADPAFQATPAPSGHDASATDGDALPADLADIAAPHHGDDVSGDHSHSRHHHHRYHHKRWGSGTSHHSAASAATAAGGAPGDPWSTFFGMPRSEALAVTAIGLGAAWNGRLVTLAATPRGRDVVLLEDGEVASALQASVAALLACVAQAVAASSDAPGPVETQSLLAPCNAVARTLYDATVRLPAPSVQAEGQASAHTDSAGGQARVSQLAVPAVGSKLDRSVTFSPGSSTAVAPGASSSAGGASSISAGCVGPAAGVWRMPGSINTSEAALQDFGPGHASPAPVLASHRAPPSSGLRRHNTIVIASPYMRRAPSFVFPLDASGASLTDGGVTAAAVAACSVSDAVGILPSREHLYDGLESPPRASFANPRVSALQRTLRKQSSFLNPAFDASHVSGQASGGLPPAYASPGKQGLTQLSNEETATGDGLTLHDAPCVDPPVPLIMVLSGPVILLTAASLLANQTVAGSASSGSGGSAATSSTAAQELGTQAGADAIRAAASADTIRPDASVAKGSDQSQMFRQLSGFGSTLALSSSFGGGTPRKLPVLVALVRHSGLPRIVLEHVSLRPTGAPAAAFGAPLSRQSSAALGRDRMDSQFRGGLVGSTGSIGAGDGAHIDQRDIAAAPPQHGSSEGLAHRLSFTSSGAGTEAMPQSTSRLTISRVSSGVASDSQPAGATAASTSDHPVAAAGATAGYSLGLSIDAGSAPASPVTTAREDSAARTAMHLAESLALARVGRLGGSVAAQPADSPVEASMGSAVSDDVATGVGEGCRSRSSTLTAVPLDEEESGEAGPTAEVVAAADSALVSGEAVHASQPSDRAPAQSIIPAPIPAPLPSPAQSIGEASIASAPTPRHPALASPQARALASRFHADGASHGSGGPRGPGLSRGGLTRTHSFSTDVAALHRHDLRTARFAAAVPETRGTAVTASISSSLSSSLPSRGSGSSSSSSSSGGASTGDARPQLAIKQPPLRRFVSLAEAPGRGAIPVRVSSANDGSLGQPTTQPASDAATATLPLGPSIDAMHGPGSEPEHFSGAFTPGPGGGVDGGGNDPATLKRRYESVFLHFVNAQLDQAIEDWRKIQLPVATRTGIATILLGGPALY